MGEAEWAIAPGLQVELGATGHNCENLGTYE